MADEKLLWSLIEASPTGMLLVGAQGQVVIANPQVERILGYGSGELTGCVLDELLPERFRATHRDHATRFQGTAHGRPMGANRNLVARRKDGSEVPVEIGLAPVQHAGTAYVLASLIDITQRTQAERALLASETYYRTILENIGDAVFVADHNGRYLDVNPRACELTGYTREELLQVLVPDTYAEDDRGQAERRMAAVTRGQVSVFERRLRRKDGTILSVEVNARLLPDGRMLATVRDITERRHAEAALRASEQRARALFETVNLIVLGLDQEGRVDYVNPYYLQLAGFTRDEVLGRDWFRFLPERLRPGMRGVFRELIESAFHPHYENAILTKAGEERMIAWNNTVVRDPQGRAIGTLSVGEDVTERNHLELQLRQAQKMEAIGRLAGGVAHDFNNVLTAVFGYVDLLREELPPDSGAQEDLGEVRKAAERAAGLTKQLLAFSRQQVLEPVVLELNDLVVDFEKMLHRVIGEDVELRLALDEDTGNVLADPGQLHQVIMNLVVNARDAMPTGGKLLIETSNAELTAEYAAVHQPVVPGPYVMLAVTDTGTGMPADVKARIFEPFFTTKEKGKGTGLGLSTVYGIVKQSGGYIWAYSEMGRGTTFKVYLPRVDAPAARLAKPRVAGTLAGNETILLAEDDAILRPLATELLTKLGYQVLAGEDAPTALAAAAAHEGPVHLLVADVVMPGMSGRELARRLAAVRPETKVLYVSGYTDDAIVHHGMLEPGLSFLQKPFTPAVLARKVRDVLDNS